MINDIMNPSNMKSTYVHRRDSEADFQAHIRRNDVPYFLRWLTYFIGKVGFAAFAFCVMAYICLLQFKQLERNTDALNDLREVMASIKTLLE